MDLCEWRDCDVPKKPDVRVCGGLGMCMASVGWAAEGPERPRADRPAHRRQPSEENRSSRTWTEMETGSSIPEEFQAFAPRVMQRIRQAQDLPGGRHRARARGF